MKLKRIAWIVACAILCASLAACGTSVQPGVSSPSNSEAVDGKAPQGEDWSTIMQVDWKENSVKLDTGINMTYLVCGPEDGVPVLLIHGATDSRISWSQVAPELAKDGYRCYIPELRGHGKSDKPETGEKGYTVDQHCSDILSLLDQIGLDEVVPVGHSLGSLITQELLLTEPEKFPKGVLISSSAKIVNNPTLDWILQGDGTDFLGVRGYDEAQEIPDDFIKSWTETTNEDANFKNALYAHAKTLPYMDWYYIFNGCNGLDNTQRLAAVTCPVDIIWGTEDVFFMQEDEELLKQSLSNAKVEFYQIDGASHNIHWDGKSTCDAVAKEIKRFISEG
ncbi:alpha/beta hydrolase [Clostridium sp. D33t1_170424_F3]|uniref:alpha/beta fold hydrolase n=1 Tax=Clostridium sp. D33t1_170424_F3 TaxID=2787099 RepID=UPI0018AABEB3|nr:alpha/beta hydrolase [Clostridium sp. D33t1_170424_F3]